MGRDQIAAIGEHGVGPGQLQRRDLHHRLSDRHAGHVFRDPGRAAGFGPASALGRPALIAHQPWAFLVADLNPGGLGETQAQGRVVERDRTHTHTDLIEEGVAREAQRVLVADRAEASPVVIREAVAAVGDATPRHQLGAGRKLAALHPRHGRHSLPGAAGVVGAHRPAEQRLHG